MKQAIESLAYFGQLPLFLGVRGRLRGRVIGMKQATESWAYVGQLPLFLGVMTPGRVIIGMKPR